MTSLFRILKHPVFQEIMYLIVGKFFTRKLCSWLSRVLHLPLLLQLIDTSSPWWQLWTAQPLCRHSPIDVSSPVQFTLSSQIGSLSLPRRLPIYSPVLSSRLPIYPPVLFYILFYITNEYACVLAYISNDNGYFALKWQLIRDGKPSANFVYK